MIDTPSLNKENERDLIANYDLFLETLKSTAANPRPVLCPKWFAPKPLANAIADGLHKCHGCTGEPNQSQRGSVKGSIWVPLRVAGGFLEG